MNPGYGCPTSRFGPIRSHVLVIYGIHTSERRDESITLLLGVQDNFHIAAANSEAVITSSPALPAVAFSLSIAPLHKSSLTSSGLSKAEVCTCHCFPDLSGSRTDSRASFPFWDTDDQPLRKGPFTCNPAGRLGIASRLPCSPCT